MVATITNPSSERGVTMRGIYVTNIFRYLTLLVALVFMSFGATSSGADETNKVLSENEAFDLLMQKVQSDSLYSSWIKIDCLRFFREESTKTYFDIAIREKHEGDCPGDPNTQPVVDRFRVMRSTKKILWQDFLSGDYVAYERVKAWRKK